jgi:hypothetical protein
MEHRLDWRDGRLWFGDVGASDEMSAARQMLALGLAKREDRMATYRGEMRCLTMGIGWAADHTVVETRSEFRTYRPFPMLRRRPESPAAGSGGLP